MIQNAYELRLGIQAPLLTHAAGSLRLGLDAATQRYRGRPVINGSLIRGNLRHLLMHFADEMAGTPLQLDQAVRAVCVQEVETWLGPDAKADGEPRIAALRFDLFWQLDERSMAAAESAPRQPQRHRVEIGDDGVVKPGHIRVAEDAFPAGTEPVFVGRIQARFADTAERDHCEHWLRKALLCLAAVGASKGVGYGRVAQAELSRIASIVEVRSRPDATGLGPRFGILMHLDRPFNIARTAQFQPKGNRLLQDDQIPGAAIKAVLASAHGGGSDALHRDLDFDHIAVTTALPAPRGLPGRALPLPLSLAVFHAGAEPRVMDLALIDGAVLRRDGENLEPPTFQPDWKEADRQAASARFGSSPARPEHLLLVRTAIDPRSGTAAEAQLFALECTDVPEHVWCADIDLHRVHPSDPDAHAAVSERLIDLLHGGLSDLGKTRARARVETRERPFAEIDPPEPLPATSDRDTWIILLRSAARLLPARLETRQISPTNGADALHAAYADFWGSASDDELALSHYYAQQELVGGSYYSRHFRDQEDYRPEWLTLPGSVFVLTSAPAARDAVAARLTDWLKAGLPPAEDRRGDHWRTDPYLGENGFGEIAVNHPAQLRCLAAIAEHALVPAEEAL